MRIVGAGGPAVSFPSARRATGMQREAQAPEAEVRALVPVGAAAASDRSPAMSRHPAAPFLAQLIATQMQAPQTRARRRAEPDEVIAVYRSMTKPVTQRRAFSRRA
jgi:hypothetical protein